MYGSTCPYSGSPSFPLNSTHRKNSCCPTWETAFFLSCAHWKTKTTTPNADTPEKKRSAWSAFGKMQTQPGQFTIYLATPHMDLHLSEMGFVVTHTSNSAPASAHRVQAARDALLSSGYDSLEIMLRHLEAHHNKLTPTKTPRRFCFRSLRSFHQPMNSIASCQSGDPAFISLPSKEKWPT